MKKYFYVTTPIYYPSGNLHIGHTYTTTLADVIARFKKEMGCEVFFLTGSDEHGQKIEQKAKQENKTPKEYVDDIVETFKDLWTKLDISYDKFIRTTDQEHIIAVQKIFSLLLKKDLIYLSKYKGKYCISCEEFLTKEQMDENCHHNVCKNKAEDFQEETYMLRVSQFKEYLNNLFSTDFLEPSSRKNEMLNNFINNDLEDLSVTRINFKWGIEVLENPNHVIYVWLDALSNYITALGWGTDNDENFNKFWSDESEILQLVGKEITRFHSIYWPIMLNSLGLRTPDKLLSHGWILSKDTKMSKSLGNVINPLEIIEKYSSDALRFYIVNNLPTDKDGNFTEELFIESYNTNLANNVGNLLSRVSNMIIKYFDGILPETLPAQDNELWELAEKTITAYVAKMNEYKFNEAINVVLNLSSECNRYIEQVKPWVLEKEGNTNELLKTLTILRHNILIISFLLKPILTKNYDNMIRQMGADPKEIKFDTLTKRNFKFEQIKEKLIIFDRIK